MADPVFNPLLGAAQLQNLVVDAQSASFENSVVSTALKIFKLSGDLKSLKSAAKAKYNTPNIPLMLFREHYPEVPISLYASTLRGVTLPDGKKTPQKYMVHIDQGATEPCRFFNFQSVVFVQVYKQILQQEPRGSTVGLVFPRSGIATGMLIHNDATGNGWTKGSCFVHKSNSGMLFVQPFANYLTMLVESGFTPIRKSGSEDSDE